MSDSETPMIKVFISFPIDLVVSIPAICSANFLHSSARPQVDSAISERRCNFRPSPTDQAPRVEEPARRVHTRSSRPRGALTPRLVSPARITERDRAAPLRPTKTCRYQS